MSCFIVININIIIVGAVPVIAVLTKADALKIPALSQLMKEKGLTSWREAKPMVDEFVIEMLRKLRTRIESQLSGYKYPPNAYITMASKHSLLFVLGLDYTLCRPESRGCRLWSTFKVYN